MKKLLYQARPPCAQCPYKLGLIHMLRNPCPECRRSGYQQFRWFTRRKR